MVSLEGIARLRLDDSDDEVVVHFRPETEEQVTRAIHKHTSLRLRARGDAYLDRNGRVARLYADKVAIVEPPSADVVTEHSLEDLASTDPIRLLALLESGELRPGLLTLAVEIAGRELDSDLVVPVLARLAEYGSPLVREGVVYGLAYHFVEQSVDALIALAEDPSTVVRQCALSALLNILMGWEET